MAIALSLPTLALSRDETDLIDYHLDRLAKFTRRNKVKFAYYEGKARIRNLGISIPPQLQSVETIVGWPGTAVDVLDERLDWLGWTAPQGDVLGLDEIVTANGLDVDASLGHLDALIAGTGFVIVGKGDLGEPDPLITVESPMRVTGEWSDRVRRMTSALSVDSVVDGVVEEVTLYLPAGNIRAGRANAYGFWQVIDREDHGLNRVTVAMLPNRPRASRSGGRSEITRALMSYTDTGVRTLLGMEVNREFYSAPQRYALNADESAFTDKDGNVRTGWEAVMGRMLAIPADEDGNEVKVGQFEAASPAPYLEQVKGIAQLVASEAAIPSNYLGFTTDNPPSADAIRAMESRLVKRAERRQATFGRGWREVAALALLIRDGSVPAEFAQVANNWRDPSTPTRAAAADEATKLIGAGVLPPDSTVTYNRLGLSPQEQRQLVADKRRQQAQARVNAISQAAEQARQDPAVADVEVSTSGAE